MQGGEQDGNWGDKRGTGGGELAFASLKAGIGASDGELGGGGEELRAGRGRGP